MEEKSKLEIIVDKLKAIADELVALEEELQGPVDEVAKIIGSRPKDR